MSILIEGMDMPKEGSWTTVRIYPDGTCAVPNWQGDCTFIKRAQAVFVTPHGRLIDADALRQDWLENYRYALTNSILDSLDGATTIIPAEEYGNG